MHVQNDKKNIADDAEIENLSHSMAELYIGTAKTASTAKLAKRDITLSAGEFCKKLNKFPKSRVQRFVKRTHFNMASFCNALKPHDLLVTCGVPKLVDCLREHVTDFCFEIRSKREVVKLLHDMARACENVAGESVQESKKPAVQEKYILESPQDIARYVLADVIREAKKCNDDVGYALKKIKDAAFIRALNTKYLSILSQFFTGNDDVVETMVFRDFNTTDDVITAVGQFVESLRGLAAELETEFLE